MPEGPLAPHRLTWNRLDMTLNRVSRLQRQAPSNTGCRAVLSCPFTGNIGFNPVADATEVAAMAARWLG
jgi:hypothetical protein